MEPEKTARKAIDVIYKDILGDINAILDKIDLQEKRVLSGTQDLTKNIRENLSCCRPTNGRHTRNSAPSNRRTSSGGN